MTKRTQDQAVERIFYSISRRLKRLENYLGVPKPNRPFSDGLPSLDGQHWREAEDRAESPNARFARCSIDLRRYVRALAEFADEVRAKSKPKRKLTIRRKGGVLTKVYKNFENVT